MKNLSLLLLLTFLISAFNAHAMLVPIHKEQDEKVVVKKQKLKFKEKVALWTFRRKIKKQLKKRALTIPSDTTDCDQILLKTGDRMDVRIINISDKDVRFVRCPNEDSSELVISKSDIDEIIMSEGVMLYKNTGEQQAKKTARKKNTTTFGKVLLWIVGAILLGMLGTYLFLLAAFT